MTTSKLLVVVDKLLTGFDAPGCTYLYIDKQMHDHGLFQAICRVNRLDGDDKAVGHIVDYKDLFKKLVNEKGTGALPPGPCTPGTPGCAAPTPEVCRRNFRRVTAPPAAADGRSKSGVWIGRGTGQSSPTAAQGSSLRQEQGPGGEGRKEQGAGKKKDAGVGRRDTAEGQQKGY